MNIMDLKVGEFGESANGIRYRIVRDEIERRPMIGRVTVRVAEDDHGRIHKFIRGIEVKRLPAPDETAREVVTKWINDCGGGLILTFVQSELLQERIREVLPPPAPSQPYPTENIELGSS